MSDTDDFTFQGRGTLKRSAPCVSKGGKPILTLIFETGGQYPQVIPIKVFGRLAEEAAGWTPGSVLGGTGRRGGRGRKGKGSGENGPTHGDVVSTSDQTGGGPPPDDDVPPPGDDDVPF